MEDKCERLEEGQGAVPDGVEELAGRFDSNDQEGEMPSLRGVSFKVVEDYEALDLLRSEECYGYVADLPSQNTKPANEVAEKALG